MQVEDLDFMGLGFEGVHAVKGSFEVAPSPQMLQKDSADAKATKGV